MLAEPKGGATLTPIGWSPDGSRIYLTRSAGKKATILAVAVADGQTRTVFELPFEYESFGLAGPSSVAMTPDGRRVVFSQVESKADIWLVEDFDPAYAR